MKCSATFGNIPVLPNFWGPNELTSGCFTSGSMLSKYCKRSSIFIKSISDVSFTSVFIHLLFCHRTIRFTIVYECIFFCNLAKSIFVYLLLHVGLFPMNISNNKNIFVVTFPRSSHSTRCETCLFSHTSLSPPASRFILKNVQINWTFLLLFNICPVYGFKCGFS